QGVQRPAGPARRRADAGLARDRPARRDRGYVANARNPKRAEAEKKNVRRSSLGSKRMAAVAGACLLTLAGCATAPAAGDKGVAAGDSGGHADAAQNGAPSR